MLGDDLQHIPMLNDLPLIVEPENIDSRVIVVSGPVLGAMKNDILVLCHDPLYLDSFARPFASHALEIVNEALLSGFHMRIVLDVLVPSEARDGLGGPACVEHQFVEGDHIRLVAFQIMHDTLPCEVTGNRR